jgi:hypothetical protein
VYTNKKSEGQFTPINSYAIQWRIDVNFIKKVKITADAPTAGVFTVSLEEKYYNKMRLSLREWNSIVYCSASDTKEPKL